MEWLYGKFYSWLTIFSTKSKIIHLSQAYAGYDFLKLDNWNLQSECIEEHQFEQYWKYDREHDFDIIIR